MHNVDKKTLIAEAATALSMMRTSADLEQRMGILQDRAEVDTGRLAAFIVTVPEGYTPEEVAVFNRVIDEAVSKAVQSAVSEVAYFQMWGHESA